MGGDYRGPHADCGHLRHELQGHAGVRLAVWLSNMHRGDAGAGRRPLSLVQEDKVAVTIAVGVALVPAARTSSARRRRSERRDATGTIAAHPFTVETRTAEVWKAGYRRSRRPR